jgi:hypothetical protein
MNIHDIKRYTEYLCRLDPKVDNNGFFLLVLIWKQDIKSYNLVRTNKGKFPITADDITMLLEIGYIEKITPPTSMNKLRIEDFRVSKKFLNLIAIDGGDAFKELLENYPQFVNINGVSVSAKVITPDEGKKLYNDVIHQDRLLHYKIIEIVKDYKTHFGKFAPCNLKNFINTKQWEIWEELIKDKVHGDNTEMLGSSPQISDNTETLG